MIWKWLSKTITGQTVLKVLWLRFTSANQKWTYDIELFKYSICCRKLSISSLIWLRSAFSCLMYSAPFCNMAALLICKITKIPCKSYICLSNKAHKITHKYLTRYIFDVKNIVVTTITIKIQMIDIWMEQTNRWK